MAQLKRDRKIIFLSPLTSMHNFSNIRSHGAQPEGEGLRLSIVAKGLLQEHFGNEFKIAAAYIGKALAWPTITKAEDIKALQAYALFLRGCANVMEELQYMQELDLPSNMKMVVFKLPYKLREQWRKKAHNIMEALNNRAHFIDLVKFIERHV